MGKQSQKPALIYFTKSTKGLARSIETTFLADIHFCGSGCEDAKSLLPKLFAKGTPIIGICASGILVRLLASTLKDKCDEPPVIAISADAQYVVPLLGGIMGPMHWLHKLLNL